VKYLLVAGVIALGAFIGAASASAQNPAGELTLIPAPADAPAYWKSGSFVSTSTHTCSVNNCGIPTHEDCSIWCKVDETPVCSCDCTNRVLGVCSELRGFCSCQRKRLSWWERNFGGD